MDDEEVARLLTEEAQDNSNKYLTEGLGAYRTSRLPGNAPKPNTRFLRHLIRETDSHNTALKRKEEREARERMRALKTQPEPPSASKSHSRRSDRSATTRDTEKRDRNDRDDRPRSHRRRTRSPSPSLDKDQSRRHRYRDERDRDRRRDDRHSHRERQRDTRHHSSSRKERRDRHRSYSRSRSRSRSPRRDRSSKSRSHGSTRESAHRSSAHRSRRDRTPLRSRRPSTQKQSRQSTPTSASTTTLREPDYALADESDPLEDLVGPLPPTTSDAPIRSRGRGAYRAQVSNIDAHFAKDYDPALDVQPEEDEGTTNTTSRRHVPGLMTGDDDWEMALEALRDRTKWRQKGEERLRAAGINEGAIDRWKNAPASTGIDTERRPEDVQWSKQGEGREWDRGKFVDDQGHIDVRAEWSK